MSQVTPVLPTVGVYSGLTAAGYINSGFSTLNTCWLGSSAPSDAPNGIPAAGQFWIDTSAAGYNLIKRYDGTSWVTEAVIDTTNHILLNPIGGGTASIASAGTTDLGTKNEAYLTITGTTTITAFGSAVSKGQVKVVTFSGALTLTYNASSMILPGAANITTANGDSAIMMSLGSGNWKCVFYGRISGAQLSMTGAAATVASATTTDLASGGSNAITVSGTTTITSFGSNATLTNPYYFVRFSGALILTYNASSLIIPGAVSITTTAGDWMVVEYLGSGNWRVNQYQRSDGRSISVAGTDSAIASATTTNLGSIASNNINITGTTTITAFGSSASAANPIYFIRFTGALTLTHNGSSLILPGSANITTAAGDTAIMLYLGSGNWRCLNYMKISGAAVVASSTKVCPGGRLTLTSVTPVLTATVSGATTVYYTPYIYDQVPLYDGTNWSMNTFAELSQATTDATKSPAAVAASSLYDVFVWSDSGTLRATRGPAWSSGTARGTGAGTTELQMIGGILTNKNAITNGPGANRGTYVGTIASNAGSTIDFIFGAQAAAGTAAVLSVWNMYNRVDTVTAVSDSGASWTYNSATIRPAHNSSTMRVTYIAGILEDAIEAQYFCNVSNPGAVSNSTNSGIGIGIDSTTVNSTDSAVGQGYVITSNTVSGGQLVGSYVGYPGLGQHYAQALEAANGVVTTTFYGGTTVAQNALQFKFKM